MTRVAVEIARVLPALADKDERHLIAHLVGSPVWSLSRGETAVTVWAVATERLLENVDRETLAAVLDVFDRITIRMGVGL